MQASLVKKISVFIVCRKKTPFESYCKKHDIPFISIPFKGYSKPADAWRLKKICHSHSIDLIHAHSSASHTIAVLSNILGCKTPVILSRRVDFAIKQNRVTLWKYNHTSVRRIICVSNAVADIIRPSIRKPHKITTVYDGIDLERFHPPAPAGQFRKSLGISADTQLVGNVAALSESKDLFTFLRAAAAIHETHSDIHFVIVGEGELRSSVTEEIKRLGLDDVVTLAGFRKDIPAVFRDLDIFLMTSKTEGLGSSIIDAFANKVPVVATRGGGIPELISHGVTGYLAPVGDHVQVAEFTRKLIDDPSLGNQFSDAAYQVMLKKFTKEIMSEQTIMHYQQALLEDDKP